MKGSSRYQIINPFVKHLKLYPIPETSLQLEAMLTSKWMNTENIQGKPFHLLPRSCASSEYRAVRAPPQRGETH